MKTEAKKIVPLAAIAILLFSISPLASASTLTVDLNPHTGVAKLDSVSTTSIVFTYPSNSTVSRDLNGVSSSIALSGSFDGSSQGALELQGSFHHWDSSIEVSNMSVAVSYSAKGNATALVITKSTDVNATVTGAFSVVNGSVEANLGWRAFVITGAMNLPFDGRTVDVNLAGDTLETTLGGHATSGWLLSAFGRGSFWNRPTLNFSALDTPMSTWTKNYDASTNTTTFSKTIPGQDTYTESADFNGQKYSLSSVSDPSGVVSVQGYANASGDTLVIAPAPASSSTAFLAAAVVAGLVVVAAGYFALRQRTRTKASPSSTTLAV